MEVCWEELAVQGTVLNCLDRMTQWSQTRECLENMIFCYLCLLLMPLGATLWLSPLFLYVWALRLYLYFFFFSSLCWMTQRNCTSSWRGSVWLCRSEIPEWSDTWLFPRNTPDVLLRSEGQAGVLSSPTHVPYYNNLGGLGYNQLLKLVRYCLIIPILSLGENISHSKSKTSFPLCLS